MTAGSWSSAHLTNGVVRPQDLASLGGTPSLAAELVSAGLWDKRRGGGWVFHDWSGRNPTREAVEKDRADAAKRQRARRDRLSSQRDSRSDIAVTHTTPTRRVGRSKNDLPDPSRVNGRASPAGSSADAAGPPWCGECDERTRLLGDDSPRRCPACHPLAEAV